MGLSQPLDQKQVDAARDAGKSHSSYGFELGFIVPNQSDWPAAALREFITHITDGVHIKWGDRFPFALVQRPDRSLVGVTCSPEELGLAPIGNIRAVVFWRYLFPDWTFVTSTGKFFVLIATGITEREWQLAKETRSEHLLLLLCRAGIGQRTIIDRGCLLDDPRWQEEWEMIKVRDHEDCYRELEAGVGQWHLNKPASA
jgi:hypothetical protein